jgi:D-alanyl-D-alanine carboxypeptidase/D-alanyl-D-alanine-endopeptidase (penicillin-binding protein 4)
MYHRAAVGYNHWQIKRNLTREWEMSIREVLLAVTLSLTLVAFAPAEDVIASTDLASRIHAVTGAPEYKHGRWGILVVEAESGRVVYEKNPDMMCIPASTTKLYSCSSALHHLGPDYKFETPVYRRGAVRDKTLNGDLILVAKGDLTLGGRTLPDGTMAFADSDHTYADSTSTTAAVTPTEPLAGLTELARQVKAAGIERVTGDVLIDDRLFDRDRSSGSGPTVVTPIMVNDNVIDVLVAPADAPGKPALVATRPESSYVQMDADVKTVSSGSAFVEVVPANQTPAGAPSARFIVRGRIPVKSKPVVRIHPVAEPAAFARALFIETLRREGVAVEASPLGEARANLPDRDGYDRLERVAVFASPPLSEAIKVTLKVSHNLYASTLPLLVAAKHGERRLADGLRREGAFLKEIGVDVGAVSFAGGAGGASADTTTARATVQLLQALAKLPEYRALDAGLPILGIDGTLATAVGADSPARGKVRAKTGTLSYGDLLNGRSILRSKALAGTMATAKGKALVFAMFVNDVPLPRGVPTAREGRTLGKLCEIIYQHAD